VALHGLVADALERRCALFLGMRPAFKARGQRRVGVRGRVRGEERER
jgi:hypothetical protein